MKRVTMNTIINGEKLKGNNFGKFGQYVLMDDAIYMDNPHQEITAAKLGEEIFKYEDSPMEYGTTLYLLVFEYGECVDIEPLDIVANVWIYDDGGDIEA